jgi:hypothetical protein
MGNKKRASFFAVLFGALVGSSAIAPAQPEVQEGNLLLGFGLNVSNQPNGYLEPGQEYVTYNPPREFGFKFGYSF